ncbi:unnamed protein product [Arabis nemorensis]|uniref:Uncharacterized protein n=1 Tax=Arabis nemorensis TaxID=586526 RepID=A0A565C4E5_9BRAS|nr:unnamed protein product [Arabis nemorensis]
MQGFPLVVQLYAYTTIPLLLKNVPNADDEEIFVDATFVGLSKLTTITMNDVLIVEQDPKDKDRKVLYMQELIQGGHVFEKAEWPGGYAGVDFVEVDEKVDMVEHERHVIYRRVPVEELGDGFVDDEVVSLKRKCKKKRKSGSKRKQRKLENYFPHVTRTGIKLKDWMETQLEEIKSALTEKIDQQAIEIARLKKKVGLKGRSSRRRKSVLLKGVSSSVNEFEEDVFMSNDCREDKKMLMLQIVGYCFERGRCCFGKGRWCLVPTSNVSRKEDNVENVSTGGALIVLTEDVLLEKTETKKEATEMEVVTRLIDATVIIIIEKHLGSNEVNVGENEDNTLVEGTPTNGKTVDLSYSSLVGTPETQVGTPKTLASHRLLNTLQVDLLSLVDEKEYMFF